MGADRREQGGGGGRLLTAKHVVTRGVGGVLRRYV